MFRNDSGAVVGFWGAATGKVSDHRMDIDGLGTSWTWCAYDTLYIPPLLDVTAQVTSPCATTGDHVRLTVSASGVTDLEPADAVVSLRLPDKPFDDNVRQTFCHYSHFFSSPEAADQWVQANPETFWVPITEGFKIVERTNAAVFPALVGAEAT